MKKTLCMITGLGVIFAAEMASDAKNSPTSRLSIPEDISQFYNNLNFAACFSTPAERDRLRLVADLDNSADLPQRLKTVGKLIRSLESKIQRIDPGMVLNLGVTDPVPAGLTEPIDVKAEDNKVTLRVRVWRLSSVDNALDVLRVAADHTAVRVLPETLFHFRKQFVRCH